MSPARREIVANQIFVGCPWRVVRPKYVKAIAALQRRFPLAFVVVGSGDVQDANELLTVIQKKLYSSSYAIFDATGGNPNVSLEFGLAEAYGVPHALYVSSHKASRKGQESVIIADLAGRMRQQYTTQKGLQAHLVKFCQQHPYAVRFERFCRDKFRRRWPSEKRRSRALVLKIIHAASAERLVKRRDIVARLLNDPARYSADEINGIILGLHQVGLIQSQQGPHANVAIR